MSDKVENKSGSYKNSIHSMCSFEACLTQVSFIFIQIQSCEVGLQVI